MSASRKGRSRVDESAARTGGRDVVAVFLLALVLVLGAVPELLAASINVENESFEKNPIPGTDSGFLTAPEDWSISGTHDAGYLNFTTLGGLSPRPDGSDHNAFSNAGDLFQELTGNNVEANKQYTVTVDVGDRNDVKFTSAGFVVELRLGVGQTFGANLLRPVGETNPVPDGGWQTWTAVFRAGSTLEATGNLRVELVNEGGLQPQFDNVRVDVEDAPPLPATREVFVRNPSFEANYAMAGETSAFEAGYQSDTPHGWIDGGTGGRGLLNHEQLPISAPPDGSAANLYMDPGGLLYQVLGEALTADTTYTLQANLGWRADSAAFGTFSALLKFGTGAAVGGGVLTAITSSTPAPTAGGWESWTLTYETGANPTNVGAPLRIELHATGTQIQFDNVQLTALAAPAPLAYDLTTTAFTSSADYTQPGFSPAETHDGNIEAAAPPYDGWAVDPFQGDPHQILWAFVAGETAVDAIQLIHVYNDNEVLHHFQLYYTTDSNPTLASTFNELSGLQMALNTSGDGATIVGSEIQVTSTTSITTGEYRITFTPVDATAIQLRTFSNSGTGNGNFVLSEISMRSSPALVPAIGSAGVMALVGLMGLAGYRKLRA